MGGLVRELVLLIKKPDTRALLLWMIGLLLVGTIFYHMVEGWSWLDAFYFCVITLSTVGFGDLSPTMPESKIFTVAYIFLGLSIFVSLVNMLAKTRREIHSQHAARVQQDAETTRQIADNNGIRIMRRKRGHDATRPSCSRRIIRVELSRAKKSMEIEPNGRRF
jgi:voltage-gated potassium channel